MALPIGVLAGLGAMLGWGVADFFVVKASISVGSLLTFLWQHLFGVAFLVLAAALLDRPFLLPIQAIPAVVGIGFLQVIGGLSFFRGLEVGKVALVSPIASSWALVTAVLSVFLYSEELSPLQILGVALVLLGVIVAATNIRNLLRSTWAGWSDPGIKPALLAMLAWGVSFAFFPPLAERYGWLTFTLWLFVIFVLMTALFMYLRRARLRLTQGPSRLFIGVAALSTAIAYLTYNFGIESAYSSIVAPVASTFPIITIVLARVFLKEKIIPEQGLGILSILSGLVLLSI